MDGHEAPPQLEADNPHPTVPPPPGLEMENLEATKILGRGAIGTVFLSHHTSHPNNSFALKVVRKSLLLHHARREIFVLNRLSAAPHPFLPHLIDSSENHDFIFWATPYCPGGDLNVLRRRQNDGVFSPAVIRFYAAEIVSAVEHLHGQLGIAYRDLKPENILVQQSGHVTLTDFDLSCDLAPRVSADADFDDKKPANHRRRCRNLTRFVNMVRPTTQAFNTNKSRLKKSKSSRVQPVVQKYPNDLRGNHRSNSFVGTEEYVAPEVIRGDGHEFAVDWWALGVLCYEMLHGITPFKGKNRKETFQKILLAEPEFVGKPNALTDLIKKLLEKDPRRRLGYRHGAAEIKEQEFFRGLRWDLIKEMLRPPFLPLREETDVKEGGINIQEYFDKVSRSPSAAECRLNVSFTEF